MSDTVTAKLKRFAGVVWPSGDWPRVVLLGLLISGIAYIVGPSNAGALLGEDSAIVASLDRVTNRLERADSRLQRVEAQGATLSKRLHALEKRLERMEAKGDRRAEGDDDAQ